MVVNRSALLIPGRIVRASIEVTHITKVEALAKVVKRTGTEISFDTKPGSTTSGG